MNVCGPNPSDLEHNLAGAFENTAVDVRAPQNAGNLIRRAITNSKRWALLVIDASADLRTLLLVIIQHFMEE
jgi:hypothetical protein